MDKNDLRLEIETTTVGLPNLEQNPSGELGTAGYTTPLSTTSLSFTNTAGQYNLWFTNVTAGGPAYFYTEYIPVTPGQYMAARYTLNSITSGCNARMRFEWADANKTLLSTGAQTTAANTVVATYYMSPIVVPASAAFVRLRWDFYSSGTGNPTAGANFTFRDVMVTKAATSAAVASTRTNLFETPSFEGFTNLASNAGAISTAQAYIGTSSYANGLGSQTALSTSMAVTANADYTYSYYIKSTGGTSMLFYLIYLDASDNVVATTTTVNSIPSSVWNRISRTEKTPPAATKVQMVIQTNVTSGNVFIDAVLVEAGTTLGAYFSGSSTATGTTSYAWSGTANNSQSVETNTSFAFVPPVTWLSILGSTHEIKVTRNELDLGTLSATILDSSLDPAKTNVIRQGKRIRLSAKRSTGVYEPVFTGRVTTATTQYDPSKYGGKLTDRGAVRIDLGAVDAISTLSQQGESRGVATIPELAYLIEGKGVPWRVNGSGTQQTGAPVVVATNDNASILDQIAITRDTKLGYAWCDRWGVINAYDSASMVTTPQASFSDVTSTSYTDVDVSFNTADVVNSVRISWLRYNSGTGSTSEIQYGPYVNQASKDTYGAFEKTFTIQGSVANENPTFLTAYATQILAANATPIVRCNSLTMKVDSDAYRDNAIALDLYTPVSVVFKDRVNSTLRITGIEHTISANDLTGYTWSVKYSFSATGSVASPQLTPSPSGAQMLTDQWQNITGFGSTITAYPGYQAPQFRLVGNRVDLRGLLSAPGSYGAAFALVNIPAGYRPTGTTVQLGAYGSGATNAYVRLDCAPNGNVSLASAISNAFVSLDGIHWWID